jgi:hypothetical protein
MNKDGQMELQTNAFLTSVSDGGESFAFGERTSGKHWKEVWMDLRGGVDTVKKKIKIVCRSREPNSDSSLFHLLA